MRAFSLLVFILVTFLAAGCVAAPITPFDVVEYPATWTPGPTSTNTPHPPTATLVIQHTPGPLPTRDPNAQRPLNAPRGGIGVWLDVPSVKPDSVVLLSARAQVFVESADASAPRSAGNFYLFHVTGDASLPDNFASRYDGVYVSDASAEILSALQKQITPRRVIAESVLHDADEAASVLQNADGLCFCNFLREANVPRDTVKTEEAWKRDVDLLAALTTDPDAIVFTATRFPDDAIQDFQEMQFWLDYAVASFLLGVNNTHAFFGFQGKGAQEFLSFPSIAAKLGTPIGGVSKANGVYQRRFTGGLVFVNPTLEQRGFALARNYVDLNGATITQVKLQPASGLILLNVQ